MTRFVNLMEGQIWIESEGVGRGSTAVFYVKLGIPARSNESKLPVLNKGPGNQIKPIFSGLKVIVMDDNRLVVLASFLYSFLVLESSFISLLLCYSCH